MAPDPRRASVPGHIDAIARRTDGEAKRLAAWLARSCWPVGGERTEPVAVDWLRRWGPSPRATAVPACACAVGACAVCN
jgi:hypothetical protein